jgi:RNA polymerase sigma-70 factor (ECF subfamily)
MWTNVKEQPDELSNAANEARVDDNALIRLVGAGDLSAFEVLYRSYFHRLTRFLDRMIRRPNLIEEIVNDTMLVVWQKAGSFDGSCKLSSWIFAIAYRKAMKAARGMDDPLEYNFESMPDESGHEPDEEAQQHELREQMLKALDALSFDHRAVVCLTYYHGLGYAEIASIMDCPVNTVKTRMHHARRRLEMLLARRAEEM